MPRAIHLLALFLALVASACTATYSVSNQETFVRALYADDALWMLEVQSGISVQADAVDGAVAALASALTGAKRFPPEQGFISFDLDQLDDEDLPEEIRSDLREFAGNVHVEEARLCRDDQRQVCFIRRTRLDHLVRTLEIVNPWLNREILENVEAQTPEAHEFRPEFPIYDEATRDLVHTAASSGHAWFTVGENALVLDVPMSEANAARCLNAIVSGTLDEPTLGLIAQVSSMRIADGHALLRFGEPHQPLIRFESKSAKEADEAVIDERLVVALRRAHQTIGSPADMAKMRAQFDSPENPTKSPK